LPEFVQLNGTLGKPGVKTDKAKVGSLAATAILNNVGGETGQKIGGALTAIEGLLGGKPAATDAAPDGSATNATEANPTTRTKPSLKDALRNLTK
jgi:hypothetical protein